MVLPDFASEIRHFTKKPVVVEVVAVEQRHRNRQSRHPFYHVVVENISDHVAKNRKQSSYRMQDTLSQIDIAPSYITDKGNRVWSFSPEETTIATGTSIADIVSLTTATEDNNVHLLVFAPHETYQDPFTGTVGQTGKINDSAAKCPIYQEVSRAEKAMDWYDSGLSAKKTKRA